MPCDTKMRGRPCAARSSRIPASRRRLSREQITVGEAKRQRVRGAVGESTNGQARRSTASRVKTCSSVRFRNATSSPKLPEIASQVRCRESGARTAMPAHQPQDRSDGECRRRSASRHAGRRAAGRRRHDWRMAPGRRRHDRLCQAPSGPLSSAVDTRARGRAKRRPSPACTAPDALHAPANVNERNADPPAPTNCRRVIRESR